MSDFIVKIEYKNENHETVVEKEYDFIQYTEMLHQDLMHILADIENAFYYFSDGEQKEYWPDEAKKRFRAIRHKILDEANSIRRLPSNLTCHGIKPITMTAGEFAASLMRDL